MLEREIETPVSDYAEALGCISIKLNGAHNRGKPDRAFFHHNTALIIEFKAPGEKPTPLQAKWLAKFAAQGFTVLCIDNIGKGKTAVDKFVAQAPKGHPEDIDDL